MRFVFHVYKQQWFLQIELKLGIVEHNPLYRMVKRKSLSKEIVTSKIETWRNLVHL